MVGLLISLIVLCIVFGVLYYIIGLIPLPAPFGTIALLLLALVFLLVVFSYVLPLVGFSPYYPLHTPLR